MDMAMPALGLLPSLRLINWLFGFISRGGEWGQGFHNSLSAPRTPNPYKMETCTHTTHVRGGYGANAHIGNGSPLHPPHAFFTWGGASTMPLLLKGGCALSPFF